MSAGVFEPARLGPLTLRNRIIKAATFEGRTPRGVVTDELIAFHRAVAAGGAGMTTVAYCAVSPDGRTHRQQLVLGTDVVPGLRRLTDAVHAEGAAIAAQIGHAGPVANARSNRCAALAPSRGFNPLSMRPNKVVDASDIARITEDFRRAARLCGQAGFDSVEIHLGHNYLPSAFLSPKLNRRTDAWGGDLERRARFPRQIVRAVRDAVPDGMAVTAKLNMSDGTAGGLWLDESLPIAAMLEADGALDALQLTGGSSLANPMYLFRGDAPVREFAATLPGWLRPPFRLFGHRFMPGYPFEEAYFRDYARQFRARLSMPLIMLGGINKLDTMRRGLAEGFAFFAMARALLREPDLPNKLRDGRAREALCVHCNKCMPTIYRGTRCVLVEDAACRQE